METKMITRTPFRPAIAAAVLTLAVATFSGPAARADAISEYVAEQAAAAHFALEAARERYRQWYASLSPRGQELEDGIREFVPEGTPPTRENVAAAWRALGVQTQTEADFVAERMIVRYQTTEELERVLGDTDRFLRESDRSLCSVGLTEFCR
jgi:hypothetical protein